MNDEMLRLFAEHEKIDGPPLAATSDDLAKQGRRRIMGRNLGIAGGLSAVAVMAAVAVLAMPGNFASATGQAGTGGQQSTTDGRNDTQPEYPLPDDLPEPPEKYAWGYSGDDDDNMRTSEAADNYGYAFTDWFASHGTEELKDWPGMAIKNRVLLTSDEDMEKVDDNFPYYGIIAVAALDAVEHGGGDDVVGLRVHSRGSFKQGAGDTYEHLFSCTDGYDPEPDAWGMPDGNSPEEPDYTCDEVTGDGDKYFSVKTVIKGGKKTEVTNSVFLFREDGTAVEVSSSAYGEKSAATPEPKLDFDELADLAQSMPDDRVGF